MGPALLVAVIAISFAAVFFRKAMPTHPLVAAALRLTFAAAAMSPFAWRARRSQRLSRSVLRSAALAGVAYALHFGAWVTSLGMTGVAASVTLVTATPLMLALFAVVSGKDRPERRHWLSIALALGGLGLIGAADLGRPGALVGDALALLGAAAMAGYMLLARRQGPALDVWAFSWAATAVGAALLWLAALVTGTPLGVAGASAWLYLWLAALVPQLVGHGLLTWSLRHTRPTVVGIATTGEPVGATLLAWLWLGEPVGGQVLAGCAVVVAAVALCVTTLNDRPAWP